MADRDTSRGEGGRAFPPTTLGFLARLRESSAEERRAGLETLCRRYWRPVYSFARAAWARSSEDAKDLAQAFLLWLVEGDALASYEAERGRFRVFLKTLLRRFAAHQAAALERLKRGGGLAIVSLEADPALKASIADAASAPPEETFDRAWMVEVSTRAIEAVRQRYAATGRARDWALFEACDLAVGEPPTYRRLAEREGIKESDVRNRLFAVRERVRDAIRAELRATVADERELQEEWNALFGA